MFSPLTALSPLSPRSLISRAIFKLCGCAFVKCVHKNMFLFFSLSLIFRFAIGIASHLLSIEHSATTAV